MLTKRQLEAVMDCTPPCSKCAADIPETDEITCSAAAAQTALTYRSMLAEIADTLDTVTDIIDKSGEWGNINALTTLETLYKAQALLKESEG